MHIVSHKYFWVGAAAGVVGALWVYPVVSRMLVRSSN